MNLTEIRNQVFQLAGVRDTPSLKLAYPQWAFKNLRKKETWMEIRKELLQEESAESEPDVELEIQVEECYSNGITREETYRATLAEGKLIAEDGNLLPSEAIQEITKEMAENLLKEEEEKVVIDQDALKKYVEAGISEEEADQMLNLVDDLAEAMIRREQQRLAALAAPRIAKQGRGLKGTFKSRRVRSDKSKGFAKDIK